MPILILRGSSSGGGGGGALTDGGSATVTGSGFGTNVVTQEWLGGISGPIESAANGATFASMGLSRWTQSGAVATRVSNTRSLSGTKCVVNDYTGDPNNFQFGIYCDTSVNQRAMFLRYSEYFYNPNNQTLGQHKLWRFVGSVANSGFSDADTPHLYFTRYYGGSGNYIPNSAGATIYTSEGGGTAGNWVEAGVWVTVEICVTPDTSSGAGNGSIKWRVVRQSDNTLLTNGTVSGRTLGNTYRYYTMQEGFYNEWNPPLAAYIDRDIYLSWNTSAATAPKYLLIGNASTFASCTKFSVCKFTAWADTSITATVNKGQHSSLTGLYWYVMSSIGTAINSNGIALI